MNAKSFLNKISNKQKNTGFMIVLFDNWKQHSMSNASLKYFDRSTLQYLPQFLYGKTLHT